MHSQKQSVSILRCNSVCVPKAKTGRVSERGWPRQLLVCWEGLWDLYVADPRGCSPTIGSASPGFSTSRPYVRFGSKADLSMSQPALPLCAKSGHRSQFSETPATQKASSVCGWLLCDHLKSRSRRRATLIHGRRPNINTLRPTTDCEMAMVLQSTQ